MKKSNIIDNFLKSQHINSKNFTKNSKEHYEFIVEGAEKFPMYKLCYKTFEVDNIKLYFGHKMHKTFFCDIIK